MKIIGIYNQKGGVGKTTISDLLAKRLSKFSKVICVDSDQSSSFSFLNDITINSDDDIITSEYGYDITNSSVAKMSILKTSKVYDYCIVDFEPTFNATIDSILKLCDTIIVPINCDFLSLQYLEKIKKSYKNVLIVLNKHKNNEKYNSFYNLISSKFNCEIFKIQDTSAISQMQMYNISERAALQKYKSYRLLSKQIDFLIKSII